MRAALLPMLRLDKPSSKVTRSNVQPSPPGRGQGVGFLRGDRGSVFISSPPPFFTPRKSVGVRVTPFFEFLNNVFGLVFDS